jgi:hypothetical protein
MNSLGIGILRESGCGELEQRKEVHWLGADPGSKTNYHSASNYAVRATTLSVPLTQG